MDFIWVPFMDRQTANPSSWHQSSHRIDTLKSLWVTLDHQDQVAILAAILEIHPHLNSTLDAAVEHCFKTLTP